MKNNMPMRPHGRVRLFASGLLATLLTLPALAQIEAYYSINGQPYVRLEPDDNSTIDNYLVVSDTPVTFAVRSTQSKGRAIVSPAGIGVKMENGYSIFTLPPGTNRHIDFGAKKSAAIVVGSTTTPTRDATDR